MDFSLKMLSIFACARKPPAGYTDGKLVGAVTHVMVADPTEGYGIFIENMINAANSQVQPKAA